ncbi:LANO_0F04698g1_1 [Lachancea nothofagi CBS 11611]|uniref:LANO_0F04698g1_1 n=1 Tax=Lachancea nothofagi CBS 11611 TaxID=1266666 RepID=A0A1G4K7S9_9SACH|nr:LANO_0F04698g1_1 [Lachancea nothofagi CBS 11611]
MCERMLFLTSIDIMLKIGRYILLAPALCQEKMIMMSASQVGVYNYKTISASVVNWLTVFIDSTRRLSSMSTAKELDSDYNTISYGVSELSLREVNLNHHHQHNGRKKVYGARREGKNSRNEGSVDLIAPTANGSNSHLAVLKNENYHLNLELTQQRQELDNLYQKLQSLENHTEVKVSLQSVPKLDISNMAYSGTSNDENESPTRFHPTSLSEYEIVTHFSGSPYRGALEVSQQDTISRASTSTSHLRRNRKFLKTSVIPFLQRSIDTFQHSEIFDEDAQVLHRKLESFKNRKAGDKDTKVKLMVDILDGVNHLQQQCIAVLNRELEVKKISSQLEYLFTIFLDPEQYGLRRQDYSDALRKEMLDIMLELLAHEGNVKMMKSPPRFSKWKHKTSGSVPKSAERLTAPLLPVLPSTKASAFSSTLSSTPKHAKSVRPTSTRKTANEKESKPSDLLQMPVKFSEDRQAPKNKHVTTKEYRSAFGQTYETESTRLKHDRHVLEFIPIGYDEISLSRRTPDRRSKSEVQHDKPLQMTPLAKSFRDEEQSEYDPLQAYFTEFFTDPLDQDDSGSTGTSISALRG